MGKVERDLGLEASGLGLDRRFMALAVMIK